MVPWDLVVARPFRTRSRTGCPPFPASSALSPAVRTWLVRRPPSWLVPCGLVLGVVVTLAYLGSMDVGAVPGCRPAAAEGCRVLAEGYPLGWLTAPQSTPMVNKYALVRDCAQWTLACSSVLYLAGLRLGPARHRHSPVALAGWCAIESCAMVRSGHPSYWVDCGSSSKTQGARTRTHPSGSVKSTAPCAGQYGFAAVTGGPPVGRIRHRHSRRGHAIAQGSASRAHPDRRRGFRRSVQWVGRSGRPRQQDDQAT
jgi:hypothetical protein